MMKEQLKLLVNLVTELKKHEISGPELYTAEMKATYYLQKLKLSPYRDDHKENIKRLFDEN